MATLLAAVALLGKLALNLIKGLVAKNRGG